MSEKPPQYCCTYISTYRIALTTKKKTLLLFFLLPFSAPSPVVYAAVELVPMPPLVYKYTHIAFLAISHPPVVYLM